MRIFRLIRKKITKILINLIVNKFSIIFRALILSKQNNCNISHVDLKFSKNTFLGKTKEIIRLKIDSTNLPKILENGFFDIFIYKFLKKIKIKKIIFIDIGSNQGLVSRQIKNLKKVKKIYAYEPNPEIFSILKKNLTKVSQNIYNYGWGNKNKSFFLWCSKFNSGDYSLFKNKSRTQKIKCQIKECNNEFNKIYTKNKNYNFVVKTDCQGYDIDIFNRLKIANIKKIKVYIMELDSVPHNKKDNFFKRLKLFNSFYICEDSINQEKLKKINYNDIEYLINNKKEFDLIMSKN